MKESLLNHGEHIEKMSTEGWIVPRNMLPVGDDIIVDWPSTWRAGNDSEEGKPFRATVDGHFFNGTIRVTWPLTWKRQEGRSTINLGADCWHCIYRVVR